ncbi:hypothetical protein [Shinella sp.]|uniref:hypothetical protein n=1 Tax=Shinella sp. TaxID=1870904 RepID=UPI0039E469B5
MLNFKATCIISAIGLTVIGNPAAADTVTEEAATSAARALEVPYMKIYRGSTCRQKRVDDRWYLKCSAGEIVGGVWAVAEGPVLVAVNGKAKQHLDVLEPVIENDLTVIPVKQWRDVYPDEIPDVQKVLKAYE